MTMINHRTKKMREELGPLTFGKVLKAHRECDEMSQRSFGKLLGVSATVISKYENGKQIPSPKQAAEIAYKLGQPVNSWIQLTFQDMLRNDKLDYKVTVVKIQ